MSLNLGAQKSSFKGLFRVVKKIGDEVTFDSDWQENLITNAGLKLLASGGANLDVMRYLHISADSTVPSFTDTSIIDLIKVSNATSQYYLNNGFSYTSGSQYFIKESRSFVFPKSNTYNASKIHLSDSSLSSATPFSSALLRDVNGDITTISVNEKEDLYVYYEIRQYWDLVVSSYDITLNVRGVDKIFNVRSQPYAVGQIINQGRLEAWDRVLASASSHTRVQADNPNNAVQIVILGEMPSDFISKSTLVDDPYWSQSGGVYSFSTDAYNDSQPYSRKFTLSFPTQSVNYASGIKYLAVQTNRGCFIYEILDVNGNGIPKTSLDTLSLTFESTVARYEGVT